MIKMVEGVRTAAHLTDEVTELEQRNRKLAREIAGEAIVLLKNNGILPVSTSENVVLFGEGVTNTVKGGSGSGEVNPRYSVSIYEGMKNAGYQIANEKRLLSYAEKAKVARACYEQSMLEKAGFMSFSVVNMSHMDQGYHEAEFGALTEADYVEANICIYVISRMSGEGMDRKLQKGDYYLSDEESANLHWCAEHYANVVLVFNTGGPVDISACDDIAADRAFAAILQMGMLGEEGGNAFADILSGKVSPSGHLTSTWPQRYEDIPGGETFGGLDGNPKSDDYREGIFVGYRYYGRFRKTPRYWFGQGLSYAEFERKAMVVAGEKLRVSVVVKNISHRCGKCVPQIYISVPEGNLAQPEAVLAGYVKTKELAPGESVTEQIEIPYYYLACYDAKRGVEVLEAGQYTIFLGKHAGDREVIGAFVLEKEIILANRKAVCPPMHGIREVLPAEKKEAEKVSDALFIKVKPEWIKAEVIEVRQNPMDAYEQEAKNLVKGMSRKELAYLLTGEGCADMVMPSWHDIVVPGATGNTTTKLHKYGLESFACCDGPAGLRFMRTSVVKPGARKIRIVEPALDMLHFMPKAIRMLGNGRVEDGQPLYMFATAFPTGTALAQTWNEQLLWQMGDAVGAEMEEYDVTVWLAPGMNIHRNPLCGRNYEYYAEDPLLSGKTGAAIIRGVQSHDGCYATIKHFFCNNQEDERQWTNANVSERALREIYLRSFGIVVKEAGARGLMSSYNQINGVWSGVCKDALTTVLRDEWKFEGIVMTDWDASHEGLEADKSIEAGITMLMAGDRRQRKALRKALQNGSLEETLARKRAVKNVQVMLLHQACQKNKK